MKWFRASPPPLPPLPQAGTMGGDLYNVNVGVLGHVDSGKTSLGKTAACRPDHAWQHRESLLLAFPSASLCLLPAMVHTAHLLQQPPARLQGHK